MVEIPIHESDVKYFRTLDDGMHKIEEKITALEITKLQAWEELKKLQELFKSFSVQLREKYGIPVDEATINIDKKAIIYEEDEQEESEEPPRKSKNAKRMSEVQE